MDFFHGAVALLSFVLMIVAGLVAWLYMQQTRLLQAVNALAIAVATPPQSYEQEIVHQQEVEVPTMQDDRVSVYEEEEEEDEAPVADAPATEPVDEDTDFTKKTVVELRSMLSAKGIPFNKSDKKTTLISLVQATT